MVTDFLEQEFESFMDYGFTAQVEGQFDMIAEGNLEWKKMLAEFYAPFHERIESSMGTEGKFSGERILGKDPKTDRTVLARMSRFGPVVQIGTGEELAEEEKPRYANLAPGQSIDDINLDEALALFSLPKTLGMYDDHEVIIGQGRFGPYVKYDTLFVSIPRTEDPFSLGLERAIELIEQKKDENAPIGEYDGHPITKGKGRFGPFLKWNELYVNVPKAIDFENITLEACFDLIAKKVDKEANRYILRFEEEGIDIENGRYGPYIKFKKKNLYLKQKGKKITDIEVIKKLSLDEVKSIISEQMPDAFETKKTKAKPKKK